MGIIFNENTSALELVYLAATVLHGEKSRQPDLQHADGTEESRIVRVPPDTAGAPFVDVDFPLNADSIGRDEYVIRTAVQEGETRDDNNQRSFALEVVDDQSRAGPG